MFLKCFAEPLYFHNSVSIIQNSHKISLTFRNTVGIWTKYLLRLYQVCYIVKALQIIQPGYWLVCTRQKECNFRNNKGKCRGIYQNLNIFKAQSSADQTTHILTNNFPKHGTETVSLRTGSSRAEQAAVKPQSLHFQTLHSRMQTFESHRQLGWKLIFFKQPTSLLKI